MNFKQAIGLVSILSLGLLTVAAQETNEVELLRKQLQQANENFEKAIQEHRRVIDELNHRLEGLQPPPRTGSTNAPPAEVKARAPVGPATPEPVAATPTANAVPSSSWNPTSPIRIGNAQAYMDIGLVGTFAVGSSTTRDIENNLESGGHDPYQRGFNVQGLELNLQGAVDPFFRANANLVYSLNSAGESFFEVEEGWMETTALPANLQLRLGQVFTEFGRHNATHLHTWNFIDTPLVNGRFLGPDGLRNPGAIISWLAPTPFYSELLLAVQNSHGDTATPFRSGGHTHGAGDEAALPFAYRHADNDRGLGGADDLLFAPRYAVSFDLTPSQVLLLGTSAAFGPNSRGSEGSGDTRTEVYGVDLTWKWKSLRQHGGFPFVQWQSEAMLRKYQVGRFDWAGEADPILDAAGNPAVLPGETLTDYGFYTQLLYGFRKGWVAGLRLDYVTGDTADYERLPLYRDGQPLGHDLQRAERWRLSPDLTWYPSEYSKIRLQYNYDNRRYVGPDHSVWLQFEFVLGAHAAHKF